MTARMAIRPETAAMLAVASPRMCARSRVESFRDRDACPISRGSDPVRLRSRIGREWKVGKIGNPGDRHAQRRGRDPDRAQGEQCRRAWLLVALRRGRGTEGVHHRCRCGEYLPRSHALFCRARLCQRHSAGDAACGAEVRRRISLCARYRLLFRRRRRGRSCIAIDHEAVAFRRRSGCFCSS